MSRTTQALRTITSSKGTDQSKTQETSRSWSETSLSNGDRKVDRQSSYEMALHQLVERQADQTPDAIAVLHQNETLTYAALNQRANQLAHHLRSLGVGPEQLVAISLVRSPEMLIAFLGVLKAGAAYVPIDPDYPAARRQYILQDANAQIVITQASLAAEFTRDTADRKHSQRITVIQLDSDASVLAQQPIHNLDISVTPQQLAYVIYTSGSTGNPKGVMAHHKGLVNYSLALIEALGLTAADRMLQFSTMSFDFIVSEVYPTLASGGSLALRTDEMMRSTQAFIEFIAKQEVTVIQFTTAFWHELVNGIARLGLTLPPSLRLVLFGGEKASLSLCRQWLQTVGDYPRLFNAYGPTEATVITTLYDAIAEGYDGSADLPIGRAILNAKTYVLDENLQPVASGKAGELCIGGPGVTRGYMNLPEKTAKVFCDDPFEPGGRLYRTGDLVKMDETGLIQFVGRVDFQVKIRGYRIELGEIESCLDQYPDLHSRIVIAREDTPGDKQLVAYVVMQPGKSLDRESLKAFMLARLPKFMMPTAVVELEALPKNANGKIDRKALPAPGRQLPIQKIVLPKSPLEAQLATLWKSVLGLEEVGITDNFFELGGNSLLVMRLFSELESSLSFALLPTDIFTAPTIEQLATRLESIAADDTPDEIAAVAKRLKQTGSTLVPLRLADRSKSRPERRPKCKSNRTAPDVAKSDSCGPLFLVHDAEGDTGLYLHLARRLHHNCSLYAIGPRTTAIAPLAYSRITQLAQDYVQQIRQVQPQGPYRIGGLCAGGVIAFEMALQLEKVGESVQLVMMDAPAPGAKKRRGRVTSDRLNRLGKSFAEDRNGRLQLKKLWQKGTNVLRYEVFSRGKKALHSLQTRALMFYQDRNWTTPHSLQILSVREVLVFAYEHYTPSEKFSGEVLLLQATDGNGTHSDRPYIEEYVDPLFGWQQFCKKKVAVKDVPGGHSTMLSSKNAVAVTQALEEIVLS